jgi:selenocysteine lyase/cysteine desulfurase
MLADSALFPAALRRTYLNSASVALMPTLAERAVSDWQRDLAEHGTENFDEVAEDQVFDDLRATFAGLIGAGPTDVAIASCATELIASVAWAVSPGPGRNVIATEIGFPSTAYPWARVARATGAELRFVPATDGVIDEHRLLETIDAQTAAVSISSVEYSNGQRYDLARVAEAAHRVGAFVLIDASQSLGAVPLWVADAPVDAIVTTSYKWLCGPFGVGLLYLAPEWQARLDPGLVGWRSHAEIYNLRADRCVMRTDARRFEFATMAYGAAIGLERSIAYLRQIGIDRIFDYDIALGDRLTAGLHRFGAAIVSPAGRAARSPIVSARFPGRDPREIVRALGTAGVVVSARRDVVRFSPHLYTSEADIDRALGALGDLLR